MTKFFEMESLPDLYKENLNIDWMTEKEAPKILVCLHHREPAEDNKPNEVTILFDKLNAYYERYSKNDDYKAVLRTSVMAPEYYTLLTDNYYTVYSIESISIWRDEKAKDHMLLESPRYFNEISIEHRIDYEGESNDWYITFSSNKPNTEKPKHIIIESSVPIDISTKERKNNTKPKRHVSLSNPNL